MSPNTCAAPAPRPMPPNPYPMPTHGAMPAQFPKVCLQPIGDVQIAPFPGHSHSHTSISTPRPYTKTNTFVSGGVPNNAMPHSSCPKCHLIIHRTRPVPLRRIALISALGRRYSLEPFLHLTPHLFITIDTSYLQ